MVTDISLEVRVVQHHSTQEGMDLGIGNPQIALHVNHIKNQSPLVLPRRAGEATEQET